jgi:uncharacterized protein YbaR (Trm112 family)
MQEKTPEKGRNAARTDSKLLEMLVCPLTQATLRYDEAASELVSDAARLAFPIRGNIPIMLSSEARRLESDG